MKNAKRWHSLLTFALIVSLLLQNTGLAMAAKKAGTVPTKIQTSVPAKEPTAVPKAWPANELTTEPTAAPAEPTPTVPPASIIKFDHLPQLTTTTTTVLTTGKASTTYPEAVGKEGLKSILNIPESMLLQKIYIE